MDEQEFVAVLLRMVERIMSVGIAGMTIYFGYRLFSMLPTENNAEGKIELPNISVVLSKVGPGVFFVGFGVIVLYQSLSTPITTGGGKFAGTMQREPATENRSTSSAPAAADAARLRRDVQVLNCAQTVLSGTPASGIRADDLAAAIADSKQALLRAAPDAGVNDAERLSGCTTVGPPRQAR